MMKRRQRIALCAPVALALGWLAACSPADQTGETDAFVESTDVAAAPAVPLPGARATAEIAGDEPPIELAPLEPTDLEGRLDGELRCAFTDGAGRPLMAAAANVGDAAPIAALVRADDVVQTLTAGSGGYDRMVDGPALAGGGLTARIDRRGEDRTPGEGLAWSAVLHLERANGGALDLDGVWTCGP